MGTAKGSAMLVSMLTWATFQRSPLRSTKDPGSGTDLSPSMSRSLSSVVGSALYRNTICLAAPIPSLLYCRTARGFRKAELVPLHHSADAHVIGGAVPNFFYAHNPGPPADKCTGGLSEFPGRDNRKSKFLPCAKPFADPKIEAMRRN